MTRQRNERGQFVPFEPTEKDLVQHFFKYAPIDGSDRCWEWRGEKTHHGYGYCRLRRKGRSDVGGMAHRISYILIYGPIPDGLHVCHKCDNPLCIRADHLFLGTDKDNSDDKVRKQRHSFGPKHSAIMKEKSPKGQDVWLAKLRNEDIPKILELRREGHTYKQIGQQFGVDNTCIYKICKGKRWAHLHAGGV